MTFPLLRFGRIDSTMNKARDLILESPGEAFIVMADEQTEGRGRIEGRVWKGSPGDSLLMTLCLKGDFSRSEALPLKIGLAVHAVLSELAPARIRIKWPNDIMGLCIQDPPCAETGAFRKLGGLLCESRGAWLLAGIGINLGPEAYPNALRGRATSLAELKETVPAERNFRLPDAEKLALSIGEKALAWLKNEGWREEYQKAMWALGEEVGFIVGHPDAGLAKRGRIRGIDGSGRLLLEKEKGGIEAFWSGEISSIIPTAQSP